MAFFSLQQVSHSFGYRRVLEDIDLQLVAGKITVICGDNGSGKSTLLQLITRFAPPQQGAIFFRGKKIRNTREKKKFLLECVFFGTEPVLFPELSLKENLKLFAKIHHPTGFPYTPLRWASIVPVLESFALQRNQDHLVDTFSTGMRQKAGLLTILLQKAAVYILDEPFNYLDSNSQRAVWNLLFDLRAAGKVILICMQKQLMSTVEASVDTRLLLQKRRLTEMH